MNQELWNKIIEFDLDHPFSEYGFSTRLATENYWTKNFTRKAILEYKKFMYLAGTSDMMVSPSEIIDVVWHQHLIFTQSYSDFCTIFGKQIQHVPSTHNKAEAAKFKQAKERTKQLYAKTFGEQPSDIWDYASMYESLSLDKAKLKIRTFILIGSIALVLLIVPFFSLLRPLFVRVGNPDFVLGFLLLIGSTAVALEWGSRWHLSRIIKNLGRSSFLFDLHPMELVYLKKQDVGDVIHATMNKLVTSGKLSVLDGGVLVKLHGVNASTLEEHQVLETFGDGRQIKYSRLLGELKNKPVFDTTGNCMNAFKKYFLKSKKFGSLFYFNFTILGLIGLIGFTRLMTGILRDRPVGILFVMLLLFLIFSIYYLHRLTKLVCTSAIPNFYKNEPSLERNVSDAWEWQYFLLGSAVLTSSFLPLYESVEPQIFTGGESGGTDACGSSCGSSCSSCGGCGGD